MSSFGESIQKPKSLGTKFAEYLGLPGDWSQAEVNIKQAEPAGMYYIDLNLKVALTQDELQEVMNS